MATTVLIIVHALCASVALVVGSVVVLRRVKGDRLHRIAGGTWAAAMYLAIAASFGIRRLDPGHFTIFHALSIFTCCTLTLGIRAARRGNIDAHKRFMIGSYAGLVGAFIGAVAVPARDIPQLAVHHPALFVLAVAGCAAASLTVLALAARVAGSPAGRRRRRSSVDVRSLRRAA